MNRNKGGVVAAGHQATAEAASIILAAGGNAFDAALAAMLAACVAEPVLASLGGGGFLHARAKDANPVVYDFFTQTPIQKQPISAINFYPIVADFGTARQTFHIGMGSIATPGFIRGLFTIHQDLCLLPLQDLMAPAQQIAKNGVRINHFQHRISQIVSPILQSTQEALALHCSPDDPSQLIQEGEYHQQPALADFLDALEKEGMGLFYGGDAGRVLIDASKTQGGHLRMRDLLEYKVVKRTPLIHAYRNARVLTNPIPSLGGTLIAFALGLLAKRCFEHVPVNSIEHLRHLAHSIRLTQQARQDKGAELDKILDPEICQHYFNILNEGGVCSRGTTQISIADRQGNLASVTLSNGEGSGYVLPNSGIMLNNMLGEEDLNPKGFHQWQENRRIASMMAPTLIFHDDGQIIVTGSGGSNRIRSAILQVISNLIDFKMPLQDAVMQPRIHYENGLLSIEPGIPPQVMDLLRDEYPHQQHWDKLNLFFGGAHTVLINAKGALLGTGDPRRGGVAMINTG